MSVSYAVILGFVSGPYLLQTYAKSIIVCYTPVNSYGHVETVSSPNHFFLGKLD